MKRVALRARTLLSLYATMVRWRSSLTLVIFMTCGAVWQQQLLAVTPQILMAGLAIASQYAALVSLNDLADEAIDRVNLRGFRSRPLINSGASRRELRVVAGAAAVVSIGAGFLASPVIGVLLLVSLVLYAEYSLPPLRLSRRAWVAPAHLALGYVLVPYTVGVVAVGGRFGARDVLFLPGLLLLFFSRSLLKDLRDRWGDAAHGKRTLVLLHGKSLVSGLSIGALLGGVALLSFALFPAHPWAAIAILPFTAGLGIFQVRLLRTGVLRDEVLLVLLAARVSNGMLLTVIGLLLVQQAGAGAVALAAVLATTAAGFALVVVQYLRAPQSFRLANEQALRPALCAVNPPAPKVPESGARGDEDAPAVPAAPLPIHEVNAHALVA
jgi:1,4-dihydroxy-2-naphthoate octaprenyltransferase/chlorophyll synthase